MIGTVGYLYAIAGIIGILNASGLLQRTIDALINSKLNQSVVGTEIIISAGLMVSSICLGSANGPAIIMWGPIADDLGKSKKLHPYRRANLMDGFGSTLPCVIPVTSAFIFIALSCVQGLMDSYTFVQKNQPREPGRCQPAMLLVPVRGAGVLRAVRLGPQVRGPTASLLRSWQRLTTKSKA